MAVFTMDTYTWVEEDETWYYDSWEAIDTKEVYEIEYYGSSERLGSIYKVRIYRRGRYLATYVNEDDANILNSYL